jgi:hypothetical protein
MDLHNYLFGLWYLINLVDVFIIANRGYTKYTIFSLLFSTAAYVVLIASLVATGDPGSLRAIFFYCWWTISIAIGVAKFNKVEDFDLPELSFAAIITCILGAIGLTLP